MGALEVAEFDELMAHETGMPIGDDEMAFALLDRQRRKETEIGAGSEDGLLRGEDGSIFQLDRFGVQRDGSLSPEELCALRERA